MRKNFGVGILLLCASLFAKGLPDPTPADLQSLWSAFTSLRAETEALEAQAIAFAGLAFDPASICNGRLTLQTGTPVTGSDVSGSTLYFTPYGGNRISLYNGSLWKVSVFSEVSLAISGLSATTNYDVFLYLNSTTPTLELTAWTNDTTRATALVSQNGVLVRSGATTRRYLGTLRPTAANTLADSASRRLLWNYCNPVVRHLSRADTTDTWTYNSITWRAANNTTANSVDMVFGLEDVLLKARALSVGRSSAAANTRFASGIGTTTSTNIAQLRGSSATSTIEQQAWSEYTGYLGAGYRTLYWLESADNTNTITFFGDNGTNRAQSGLVGEIHGG